MAVDKSYNSINDVAMERILGMIDDCSQKNLPYEQKISNAMEQLEDLIKIDNKKIDNKNLQMYQNMKIYRNNYDSYSYVIRRIIKMYKDSSTSAAKHIASQADEIGRGA